MKLLFLAMAPAGFGETLIGLSLADQLAPHGVRSHFVIEEVGRRLLRGSDHGCTTVGQDMGVFAQILIDDVVEQTRPDAIVLADYQVHCGSLPRRYGLDPWFVDRYRLPIIPIDIWEWGKTDFAIDMAGDHAYRISDRLREMPGALRPVPLAHPDPDPDHRARPFRTFEGERITRRTRGHLRTSLGLSRADRLVLLATAGWQHGRDNNYSKVVGHVRDSMMTLVAHYLEQLPDTTHFLLVGEVPEALRGLPADRVHMFPSSGPQRFATLLGSVDLVLTLNIGAATAGRAVMSGIPVLVLGNRFFLRDADEVEKADADLGGLTPFVRAEVARCLPLFPFRLWPLGWHRFLEPMLTGNPFCDAITQAEILDEPAVLGALTGLLYDRAVRDQVAARQAAYAGVVRAMPDTGTVFAQTLHDLGMDGRF